MRLLRDVSRLGLPIPTAAILLCFACAPAATSAPLFSAPFTVVPTGLGPCCVLAGDLNNDGFPDIVTVNGPDKSISILLGDGDGSFRAMPDCKVGVSPNFAAVGDVDGDGKPDLVVTDHASGTVSILTGRGDGTFLQASDDSVGRGPNAVALADLDSDGNLDIVTANDAGSLTLLMGSGHGNFRSRQDLPVDGSARSVVVADMNGDGRLDLLTANGAGSITVFLGVGSGIFGPAMASRTIDPPNLLAVHDFNGDGYPDVAASATVGYSTSVMILDGSKEGYLIIRASYYLPWHPWAVASGDFNGDGKTDLVVGTVGEWVSGTANSIAVLMGNADGSFGPPSEIYIGSNPTSVAVADVTGDGRQDILATNSYDQAIAGHGGGSRRGVFVLASNGDGTFGRPNVDSTRSGPVSGDPMVATGDLDGNGIPDWVRADNYHGTVTVYLERGTAPHVFSTGPFPTSVAIGDLNGDGIPDIVTTGGTSRWSAPGAISVLLGHGDGTFEQHQEFTSPYQLRSAIVHDFNGDGRLDVAAADAAIGMSDCCTATGASVSVFLGNGDGTLAESIEYPTGAGPSRMALGDVNGDGVPDLVTANSEEHDVSVLLGRPDGTFAPPLGFGTSLLPDDVALRDENGDGTLDILASGRGPGVAVLLGAHPKTPIVPGPASFVLLPPRPNPSSGSTELAYEIPRLGSLTLAIYNLSGQLVRTLLSGQAQVGLSSVRWDGRGDGGRQLPAGVYFARLQLGSSVRTQRIVTLR